MATLDSIIKKLNPGRFPNMSPLMAAVVGYVPGQSFTDPEIAEITVSEAEGVVYLRKQGDVGFNGIENIEDLRRNWNRLMDAAGLSDDERTEAVRLFYEKIPILPGTRMGPV